MTEPGPLLRSFVAVPLPGTVQAEIAEAARALARDVPREIIKWSKKPENLHVTLKFLGSVAEDRLADLATVLDKSLRLVPSFGLDVRGFGAFPSAGEARVVFAGIDDTERGLARVAELVEDVTFRLGIARFGFPRQARPFRGHVTVGRCRDGVDTRAALTPWADHSFGAVAVGEVHVYESRLGGEGSTYILRHRASLGAAAAPRERAN